MNIGMVFLRSVMPVTLFCIANWCLTLMLDGEGTMPQIFIGLCYALIPLTAVNFLNTLLSNVLTLNESTYISFLTALGFLWTGLLVVVSVMEINQYSFSRAIAACLLSIVASPCCCSFSCCASTWCSRFWSSFNRFIRNCPIAGRKGEPSS